MTLRARATWCGSVRHGLRRVSLRCANCVTVSWIVAASTLGLANDLPEVQASAPTSIAVTVYRDDLALITETRTLTLPSGTVRVLFDGVMDRMLPTSVVIDGLDDTIERNFSYDGLNPRSLLWRSVGEPVVVTHGPTRGAAVRSERAVVAAAGDGIVLNFADHSEALGCSGLPERLTFERIPAGLRARPMLSTTLNNTKTGQRDITLSYLVLGVAWRADYTLTLEPDAQHAQLGAWITLTNQGEQGISDASVGVVAGELSRVWDGVTAVQARHAAERACWPMGTTSDFRRIATISVTPPASPPPQAMMMKGAQVEDVVVTAARKEAVREALADYQLYRLPFTTDVLAAQTKQVMLMQPKRIALQRLYSFVAGALPDNAPTPVPVNASILLRARNDRDHGLGEPLPSGNVNVFTPYANGDVLFTASGETIDTPTEVNWRVELGQSPAVTLMSTLVARARSKRWFSAGYAMRDTVKYEIANDTDAEQKIELAQQRLGASLRISNNQDPFSMQDGLPTWKVVMPAHSKRVLNYVVSYDEVVGD